MKLLKILFSALIFGVIFTSCGEKPIDGVFEMKRSKNTNVWETNLNISEIQNQFKNGSNLRIGFNSNIPLGPCAEIERLRKLCLQAARGNWEGDGNFDNPLGDVACCNEYFDKQQEELNCGPIIPTPINDIIAPIVNPIVEQLVIDKPSEKLPIAMDLSSLENQPEKAKVGFINYNNRNYIAIELTQNKEKKVFLQNLNYTNSNTYEIPQASLFSIDNYNNQFSSVIGDGSPTEFLQVDTPYNPPGPGGVTNCGGQASDKPKIKNKGGNNLRGSFCINCEGFCVPYKSAPIDLEFFMQIGYPFVENEIDNEYHNKNIITKIIRTTKSDVVFRDLDNNYNSAIEMPQNYTPTVNLSSDVPITIDDKDFKPYLRYDSLSPMEPRVCPTELEVEVNRIIVPVQLNVGDNFFNSNDSIILVAIQIVYDITSNNLIAVNPDPTIASDHSNMVIPLENELLFVISKENKTVLEFYKPNGGGIDTTRIDNIYLCRSNINDK